MPNELNQRQKKLLIFIGSGANELDPIRIMKGLFVYEMKALPAWKAPGSEYTFRAYDYGPFSSDVYRDLEYLISNGYVKSRDAIGRSWKFYSISSEGTEVREQLIKNMPADAVAYIYAVYRFVTTVSFRKLLESVYKEFPDYAVNSVFRY